MKISRIPYWRDEVDGSSLLAQASTSSPPNSVTSLPGNEVNHNNYENISKDLVPPFNGTLHQSYGSIQIPPTRPLLEDDDDEDDDDDDDENVNGGFASEAGWSRRMSRRNSISKSENCCVHYIGICFVLCYTIFSSISGLTVKLLERNFHAYPICLWRFVTIFLISMIVFAYTKAFTKKKLWPRSLVEERNEHMKHVSLLMIRGILGCFGRILYIYSITCMTLSDAVVIASSSPVFMTFFAYFLLGESCGLIPVFMAFLTLLGVGIITRPPWLTGQGSFDSNVLTGVGTGVGGMILTTLVMVVMRKLRHVNVTLITLSFASWGAITALGLCYYEGLSLVPSRTWGDVLLLIASGSTSFLGQTFLALGLKYESAGVVALLTNFAVVFSFIFEYIFLNVAPDIYSITGGIVVIICIVVTTFRKWIGNLPEDHDARKVFAFLLI